MAGFFFALAVCWFGCGVYDAGIQLFRDRAERVWIAAYGCAVLTTLSLVLARLIASAAGTDLLP